MVGFRLCYTRWKCHADVFAKLFLYVSYKTMKSRAVKSFYRICKTSLCFSGFCMVFIGQSLSKPEKANISSIDLIPNTRTINFAEVTWLLPKLHCV